MKFSLSSLKQHFNTTASLDQLCERMVDLGIEVEGIDDPALKFKNFILGRITSFEKHPNADKLNVCQVDIGDKTLNIVCGASNVSTNMLVCVALPGAMIPSSNKVLTLGKIRDVESQGMLCSEEELSLATESEGIMSLKTDLPLGSPIAEVLAINDAIIDVSITPNRGDLFSVYGIARDLAASGLGGLNVFSNTNWPQTAQENIEIKTEKCPAFYAIRIENVQNKQSPDFILKVLRSAGMTPKNLLIDVTNYMALVYGRPMHAFDADKVKGNLVVRMAKDGETLLCINDMTITLSASDIVVADDSGVLALAGIMGGSATAIGDDTKNIILEAAVFDPISIALSGQYHNINSEARTRLERGVDALMTKSLMSLAAEIVTKYCGGKITAAFEHYAIQKPAPIEYSLDAYTQLTGLQIRQDLAIKHLENLGFDADATSATPPSWRHDIAIEEDIVEELLRMEGFGSLESTSVPIKTYVTSAKKDLQKVATELGLNECYTWSMISHEVFAQGKTGKPIELQNPITANMAVMRPSLLTGLLDVGRYNKRRGNECIALFEKAHIYLNVNDAIVENEHISGIRFGASEQRRWYEKQRSIDIFDVKNDAITFLNELGVVKTQITRNVPSYYHPGRSGALQQGKNILGYFGELHPNICDLYELPRVCCFEIFIDACPPHKKKPVKAPELSPYQINKRDLSFVLKKEVTAQELLHAVNSVNSALLSDVSIFDVYNDVSDTEKSIAIQFALSASDHTLSEEEMNDVIEKIVKNVELKCGGYLRLSV